jgi:glycosyltransferase involved in cell wall biosynthesis
MVLVEAFAHGLPVVVSRLGALGELVEDGVSGLQFTTGDAADLAATLTRALADERFRHEAGAAARAIYLERYTPQQNLSQLISIYRSAGARGH